MAISCLFSQFLPVHVDFSPVPNPCKLLLSLRGYLFTFSLLQLTGIVPATPLLLFAQQASEKVERKKKYMSARP